MREILDSEIEEASTAELEALEFRIYAELRDREETALSEMTAEDSAELNGEFDDSVPF